MRIVSYCAIHEWSRMPSRRSSGMLLIAALAISACRGPAMHADPPVRVAGEMIVSAVFGATGDQLLETACPDGRDPELQPCSTLIVDLRTNRARRIQPGQGRSLLHPSFSEGQIIVASVARTADAKGNHATDIVALDEAREPAEKLWSSTNELRFPRRLDGSVYAWVKMCYSPSDRYCAHDLHVYRDGRPMLATLRRYGFREAGRIVTGGEHPIVTAGFPAEALAIDSNYVEWADGSSVWRLRQKAPFGLEKLASDLSIMAVAPATRGSLIVFGSGTDGLGLYRLLDGRSDLLGALPASLPIEGSSVLGIDVAPDDKTVALLVSGTPDQPRSRLMLFDVEHRRWRTVPEPQVITGRQLAAVRR